MQLYQRAGDPARALQLCADQSTNSRPVAGDIIAGLLANLGPDASEVAIRQCAEACEKFGRPEEAVKLYARCGDFSRAIEVASESRVPITRELSDVLTPTKGQLSGTMMT